MSTLQHKQRTVEEYPEVGAEIEELSTGEVRILVDDEVRQSWQPCEDAIEVAQLWVNGFIYGTD